MTIESTKKRESCLGTIEIGMIVPEMLMETVCLPLNQMVE